MMLTPTIGKNGGKIAWCFQPKMQGQQQHPKYKFGLQGEVRYTQLNNHETISGKADYITKLPLIQEKQITFLKMN